MFKKFFAVGAICLLCVVPTALATDGPPPQDTTLVDVVVEMIQDLADWIGDFTTTESGEDDEDGEPDFSGQVDPVG